MESAGTYEKVPGADDLTWTPYAGLQQNNMLKAGLCCWETLPMVML